MVHALDEIEGALAPGGLLVDLRPLLDRWPVEVAWTGGSEEVGSATDLPEPLADDAAANSAMVGFATSGRWQREREGVFPLYYYWDTPKEMEGYIAEQWDDVITIEESVWKNLRSLWAGAAGDARPRLRMKMSITRYRKAS